MNSARGVDGEPRPQGRIAWNEAVFGAAMIGGVAYGLVATAFVTVGPHGRLGWLPGLAVTFGLLAVGVLVCRITHSSRWRTAGAAVAAAALLGGPLVVEMYVIWLVFGRG